MHKFLLCQIIHLGLVGPLSPNQAFKTKSIGRDKKALQKIKKEKGKYSRKAFKTIFFSGRLFDR